MKQTLGRSGIVAFALFSLAAVALILFVGEPNHYEKLDSLLARFDTDPTPEHLRALLNYPADGAYSYYQMALVGAAFAKHPDNFREVSDDLQTEQERRGIELLSTQGPGVFEYHPEFRTAEFDKQLRDQSWLIKMKGEQGSGGDP